jgi:DNA-binding response OmpR family regulator
MSGTVLIVDDSLTVRMDLAESFEAAGFRTLPCASIGQARELLARGSVDVLVLDVLLPDGNGVDFLIELRSQESETRAVIMMLSSETEVADRLRGLARGADEYVGKPYDAAYVVGKSRELLRARSGPRSSATTVLVIDDSATFREELRQAFTDAGYRVVVAASGEEGLRLADERPSAIVVDGVLPGIDGATVIRRIRLDVVLRGTPCLLLTAADDAGAELRALEAGADAFVRKEDDVAVILAKFAAMVRRSTTPHSEELTSLSGPKRILAVDDSLTYLHEIAQTLRGEGYDVVLARSGEQALELLAVQPVDCILLDLLMPGLSGQETCRRIKANPALCDVPLIMLTALEDRAAMIEGLGSGADDYISKSSDFAVLKARVRAQIRRRQFEAENERIQEELLRKDREAFEARAARELAETRASLVAELERKNKELEAFSYSVSHDLRAPLRSIHGFSHALLEDYAGSLDDTGRQYLNRLAAAAERMGELIDDLLELSRVGRAELNRHRVDLAESARAVVADLRGREPGRTIDVQIHDELVVEGDRQLLRAALENLIGNAWKFTSRRPDAHVWVGAEQRDGGRVFFVRDDGAGFDARYQEKLFHPFQRLHRLDEFPGTGIGLATVHRIIDRHGGRIWAESTLGQGATFYFTIPAAGRTVAEAQLST